MYIYRYIDIYLFWTTSGRRHANIYTHTYMCIFIITHYDHTLFRRCEKELRAYMLNTQSEEYKTIFYSYLARFMNIATLNMNLFLSNAGFSRRNTVFIFVWLRPRNT